MDKWRTQHEFWSSFGIPAYDENTAFEQGKLPAYPHITYEALNGVMGQVLPISASIWYRSSSWEEISKKADQILSAVKHGVIIAVDNGYFWIKNPELSAFAQRMASGSDDDLVKRIYITLEAESLTAY